MTRPHRRSTDAASVRRRRHRRTARSILLGATTMLVVAVTAACSVSPPDNTSVPINPSVSGPALVSQYPNVTLTAPRDSRGPGGVVALQDPPTPVDPDLTSVGVSIRRIVYRSTSGLDSSPTEVSGIVVVPNGPPPDGGWPVVAYGRPNSGIQPQCAPSLFGSMLGNAEVMANIAVSGYVVVMSDYQGIGQTGPVVPFLDATTYGNNLIDAVRAAHALNPTVISTKWISYGGALGGLASWAAGDRSVAYGQGLDLLGSASIAPWANMTGLVDRAVSGTLNPAQYSVYIYTLQSIADSNPSMNLDDYRSPYARSIWPTLLQCLPTARTSVEDIGRAITSLGPDDLKPNSIAAAAFLKSRIAARALPVGANKQPALIIYGTDDQVADVGPTEAAITQACQDGQRLFVVRRAGETQEDLKADQAVDFVNTLRLGGGNVTNCGDRP
ncbi:MAG: alpha/beta hydrolase [Corynebacteriales bacterium]|nr:alpha/beta hydrolase [Mycobacteriales bacterium]